MNKKHFIILTAIIFVITSLIGFLLPMGVKNISSFIIIYIVYLLFNVISVLIIAKNMNNIIKKEIHSLSIYYIFGIFNLILMLFWFLTKFVHININISLIILLIILLIYALILYSLIYSKKFINQKETDNNQKIKIVKNWLTKIEIILNDNKDNEELNKLYELVRYMDPISTTETQVLDEKITGAIDEIVNNVTKDNIEKAIKLLNERKIILKNNK